MQTALCAFFLCIACWQAQAQPAASASHGTVGPHVTPVTLFNVPVTENGYVITVPEQERVLSAVHVTIRPETATVFGFHLAAANADSVFTLSYDLVSQQLHLTGSGLASAFTLYYPLVNNALRFQLTWKPEVAAFTVDDDVHPLVLTKPLPASPLPSFFADAGMVQVTHFTAWYTD